MNILQNNPYRLLGVYSNSPTKERLANHNRMKAFLKVGKPVSFPLDLPSYLGLINRTDASVADAEAKLTLPKDQILYAQFWFVKATPLDDVAFNHLLDGDMDGAIEIWRKKRTSSSLQNLFVCSLIRGYLFLALYYAEKLYSKTENVHELVSYISNDFSVENPQILTENLLDNLCAELGAKELLKVYKPDWSLLDFAREHGKMKVAPFVNKETGETFKSCAFINTDGEVTLVAFWSRLGELTPAEIVENKENLFVTQLPSGYYKLVFREIIRGEWRKYIVDKYAAKFIADIQNCIELARKSKGKQPKERLLAGEQLRKHTTDALTELSSMLTHTDLQYQMIADELGLEILQCGIDYYNDSEEPDAAIKAMSLQKYALSIVVGQAAKDRCKENVDILQKIIDDLPPFEVFTEDKAIKEELHKYCQLPDLISHAVTLLENTQPYLVSIKDKLGADNECYLKISTLVVNNALNNVIAEINEAQKYDPAEERRQRNKKLMEKSDPLFRPLYSSLYNDEFLYESVDRKTKYEYIKRVVLKAKKALLIMDVLDMEKSFEQERYLPNRKTINDFLLQLNAPLPTYKPLPLKEKIMKQVEDAPAGVERAAKGIYNEFKDDKGCLSAGAFIIICMIVGATINGRDGVVAGFVFALIFLGFIIKIMDLGK